MRDIRASVEVRALIGAEKLCELHEDAFARYECWQCGGEGRTTEPTSVIVLAYRVFRVVRLAHAACADSQIIEARRRRDEDSGRANRCTATRSASPGSRWTVSLRREPPGKEVPGMKTTRIARKLGLDGNPLRRRTDKIAACLAALLLAVFLIGAPFLSVAAAGWAGHPGPPGCGPSARGIRFPPSCCGARRRPPPPAGFSAITRSWPGGPHRTGGPGPAGSRSAPTWPLAARSGCGWTPAGSPTGPPPNHRAVVAREATAAVAATAALGIVLLCLAWAGRWVLDRRRLADWEAAWAAVGPQWTKRFRSRG